MTSHYRLGAAVRLPLSHIQLRARINWALRNLGILLLVAVCCACSRDAPPLEGEQTVALPPSGSGLAVVPSASTSAPAVAPPLARKEVVALVDRWVQAQNDSDFAAYSALYSTEFAGTKRVGEKVSRFDYEGWLADRKPMFDRDVRVAVSDVQVFQSNDEVRVLFEQQWSTSTFADRGTKALTLRRSAARLAIVREEMLTSRTLEAKKRTGVCAVALRKLAEGKLAVQRFADLGSKQPPHTGHWAAVASHEDAHNRAAFGLAGEIWTLAPDAGWWVAELTKTSLSGDWVRYSTYCFRPDGTLAEAIDSHRTFYSLNGLVNDTVFATYDRDGKVTASKSEAYYMETGKTAEPDTYLRPPTIVVHSLTELPFHEVRKQLALGFKR